MFRGEFGAGEASLPHWMKPWYGITTHVPSISEYEILVDINQMVEKRDYQTTKFNSWPNFWLCHIVVSYFLMLSHTSKNSALLIIRHPWTHLVSNFWRRLLLFFTAQFIHVIIAHLPWHHVQIYVFEDGIVCAKEPQVQKYYRILSETAGTYHRATTTGDANVLDSVSANYSGRCKGPVSGSCGATPLSVTIRLYNLISSISL